jgi:microcompartment protein CcmL/EutN
MKNCIGLIEVTSIATGFEAGDAMIKAAAVELLLARSICSGKYMVLIGGEVANVEASIEAGAAIAQGSLIDRFVIPNIHPDVFRAISRSEIPPLEGALGILESFNVATLIEAADTAVKTAAVRLLEVRLAMAMGGKAFCTVTGDVAAVQASVAAGRAVIAKRGLLVNAVVIPRPSPELYREMV